MTEITPNATRLANLWTHRDELTVDQWEDLYRLVAHLCANGRGSSSAASEKEIGPRFWDFFIRRVMESTPSGLDMTEFICASYSTFVAEWRGRPHAGAPELDGLLDRFHLEEGGPVEPPLPLTEVRAAYFRPSDELLRRYVAGDATVSDNLKAAIDRDPTFKQVVATLRGTEERRSLSMSMEEIPDVVVDYIDRRVASARHTYSQFPSAGQIVRIDRLIGPAGDLGIDLARPLCAAIASPVVLDSVWWGWLVSAEAHFACQWDLILEADDEPIDPIARVVQVWNPVKIYVPSVMRVIGELRPERLEALRALAAEFLTGRTVAQDSFRTKDLRRRGLAGHSILTGPELSDSSDERWRYQKIYQLVGEIVQEPSREAEVVLGGDLEAIGGGDIVESKNARDDKVTSTTVTVFRVDLRLPANEMAWKIYADSRNRESDGPLTTISTLNFDGNVVELTSLLYVGERRLRLILKVIEAHSLKPGDILGITLRAEQVRIVRHEMRFETSEGGLVGWVDCQDLSDEWMRQAEASLSLEIELDRGYGE